MKKETLKLSSISSLPCSRPSPAASAWWAACRLDFWTRRIVLLNTNNTIFFWTRRKYSTRKNYFWTRITRILIASQYFQSKKFVLFVLFVLFMFKNNSCSKIIRVQKKYSCSIIQNSITQNARSAQFKIQKSKFKIQKSCRLPHLSCENSFLPLR